MKSPISAAIAIGVGLVVLLGYFLTLPVLEGLRTVLLGWAITLAAVAAWVGVVNLLSVHWKKIRGQQKGSAYSWVLIAAFALTLAIGTWEIVSRPQDSALRQVVNGIQIPVEASLMGILTVSLAFAAMRLLRRQITFFTMLFFVAILVFLLLGSGLPAQLDLPIMPAMIAGLQRLPLSGARGILLGVALGSLTTGLRILMGADRPYGS